MTTYSEAISQRDKKPMLNTQERLEASYRELLLIQHFQQIEAMAVEFEAREADRCKRKCIKFPTKIPRGFLKGIKNLLERKLMVARDAFEFNELVNIELEQLVYPLLDGLDEHLYGLKYEINNVSSEYVDKIRNFMISGTGIYVGPVHINRLNSIYQEYKSYVAEGYSRADETLHTTHGRVAAIIPVEHIKM